LLLLHLQLLLGSVHLAGSVLQMVWLLLALLMIGVVQLLAKCLVRR
jgi:hypothetical protein